MLVKALELKDYANFSGRQKIEFNFSNDGRNITLILAPNNSGKTTIIRALRFLLYGESDKGLLAGIPSQRALASLDAGDVGESYVAIEIEHGPEAYRICRYIDYQRASGDEGGSLLARVLDTRLEVYRHHDYGDEALLDSRATADKIRNIVPEEMFDFYFFKGEELALKLLGRGRGGQIPEQLEKMLYKQEWEALIKSAGSASRGFGTQLAQQSKKLDEYKQAEQLKDLSDKRIREWEADKEKKNKGVLSAREKLREADSLVQQLASQSSPDRKRELDQATKNLDAAERRSTQLEIERRTILGRDVATILVSPALSKAHDLLEQLGKKRPLPPDISEGILTRIMHTGVCICERSCEQGTPEYEAIESLHRQSLASGAVETLVKLQTYVDPSAQTGARSVADRLRSGLEANQKAKRQNDKEIARLEDYKKTLEEQYDESVESRILAAKRDRQKVREEIERLNQQVREIDEKIRRQESVRTQAERKMREASGARAASWLERARDLAKRFADLADRAKQQMLSESARQLQQNVSEMYDSIVTDGSVARLDPNTLLPSIEKFGAVDQQHGGGQEQVLVLAYLISLAKLRATMNAELRERFQVQQFYEQGFFMDSVFGSTQKSYRREIVGLLPQHMKQLVVLLADQQWDENVAAGLLDAATDLYGFEYHTGKEVNEEEYRYDVGESTIDLLVREKPKSVPYTTIKAYEIT